MSLKPIYVNSLEIDPEMECAEPSSRISRIENAGHRIHAWLWELLSLLLSIACLTAIFALFIKYDGKPVPDLLGFTLNTVISVLAGISKAALILPIAECISQLKWYWFWNAGKPRRMLDFEAYDVASRGPLGSLMLLSKPRMWHVATLGAFLTVAAVAMEPAIQQMPAYPLQSHITDGVATIPISKNYTDFDTGLETYGIDNYLGETSKGAVYSGLYGSSSEVNTISPFCPSGNCSWPEYSTLSVCSICVNVSSYFARPNASTWWSLPNGLAFGSNSNAVFNYGINGSIVLSNTSLYSLVDWAVVYTVTEDATPDWMPLAEECMLYLCIKTHKATVVNGIFNETTLSVWPDPQNLPNKTLGSEAEIAAVPRWKPVNLSPPGSTDNITIAIGTWSATRYFLYNLLQSSGILTQQGYGDFAQLMYNMAFSNFQLPTPVTPASPAAIFERIADRWTSQIRNMATTTANGETFAVQTILQVRWTWIGLPLALLIGAISFMLLTLLLSIGNGLPTWKSSSMPTLLHGLKGTEVRVTGARAMMEDVRQAEMVMNLGSTKEFLVDTRARLS